MVVVGSAAETVRETETERHRHTEEDNEMLLVVSQLGQCCFFLILLAETSYRPT
jgi:hypothetical protein